MVVLKRCHLMGFCYPPSTPSLSPSLPFLNLPQDPPPCPTQGILPTCRRSPFLSFQHTQVPQACLLYKYSILSEGNSDEFNFSTPMHQNSKIPGASRCLVYLVSLRFLFRSFRRATCFPTHLLTEGWIFLAFSFSICWDRG